MFRNRRRRGVSPGSGAQGGAGKPSEGRGSPSTSPSTKTLGCVVPQRSLCQNTKFETGGRQRPLLANLQLLLHPLPLPLPPAPSDQSTNVPLLEKSGETFSTCILVHCSDEIDLVKEAKHFCDVPMTIPFFVATIFFLFCFGQPFLLLLLIFLTFFFGCSNQIFLVLATNILKKSGNQILLNMETKFY